MTLKIDLMQVQLQKNIFLLDALHLVAMSWKRASEKTIENCFRKGGFSKTNAETPDSEEFNLTSEIFDQAPDGRPRPACRSRGHLSYDPHGVRKLQSEPRCACLWT
jgi:hypothetical protein